MRLVLLTGLLVVAAPVAAQESQPAAPAAEKKICRSAPATGSILGKKRECHTKVEWEAIAEQSRGAREKYDNDLRTQGGRTGITRD